MSIFATRLRELRGAEPQASFAAAIGINRVQYAKYESGVNSPSVAVLATICRVHACSADWLLGIDDGAPRRPSYESCSYPSSAPAGQLPQCARCEHRRLADKLRKMIGGG